MITEDVEGTFIKGKVELEKPGDFIYYVNNVSLRDDKIVGMVFVCPCGCDGLKTISFGPRDTSYVPVWTWDGNIEEPTLTPEIQCGLKEIWRGRLTKGVFTGIVKYDKNYQDKEEYNDREYYNDQNNERNQA